MRLAILLFTLLIYVCGSAQKIDSIFFNLYTDSLKKGFYNYINVDGKTADGRWFPLTADEVEFSLPLKDTSLFFKNNDLFIDSSYIKATVRVKAVLKSNPTVWKEVTIYIRRRGFDESLKTNEEIWQEYSKQPAKKKKS
jgi:hypothetical protein